VSRSRHHTHTHTKNFSVQTFVEKLFVTLRGFYNIRFWRIVVPKINN